MLRPYTWGTPPCSSATTLSHSRRSAPPREPRWGRCSSPCNWPTCSGRSSSSLGWEQAHLVPGPNPFLMLWLDSIPISHSLLTLIAWGVLFAAVYRMRTGYAKGAIVVALAVVSHWVLDVVTHRPDMPLYPGGPKLGLGLWNSVTATVIIEVVMFAAGTWIYPRTTRARSEEHTSELQS